MNAQLIANKISPKERLIILNKEANKEKELFNRNNEKPTKRIKRINLNKHFVVPFWNLKFAIC